MSQKSIVQPLIDDAKDTAVKMEKVIREAGIDGIIVEVEMKTKFTNYVIKVLRKGVYPRDDEWTV